MDYYSALKQVETNRIEARQKQQIRQYLAILKSRDDPPEHRLWREKLWLFLLTFQLYHNVIFHWKEMMK